MPPRASRRLAVLLLPDEPSAPRGLGTIAFAALEARSLTARVVIGGNGLVGPEERDAIAFVSNRQGGFSVRCPLPPSAPGGSPPILTRQFAGALERWRSGAERSVVCECGTRHDLAALAFAPPAGFARTWLRIEDAASGDVDPVALTAVAEVFGGVRILLRRG